MKRYTSAILFCTMLVLSLTSCATKANEPVMVVEDIPSVSPAFVSQVDFPAYYFGEDVEGYTLPSFHDGNVILAKENAEIAQNYYSVPAEFSNGTVIISYSEDYYYNGKKRTGNYELIYFNTLPEPSFSYANLELPIPVYEDDAVGVATAESGLFVRCKRLDEHLVCCARRTPKYDGEYWYFNVESLDTAVPKFLLFQPVSSRSDEIIFKTDGLSETLEEITLRSDSADTPCSYPSEQIRIQTKLSAYPEISENIGSIAEYIVRQQNFTDMNGNLMNLDVTIDFDGLTWHIMFPNYFIDYLTDEYTLGDDIYLYAYICYSLDGELYLYGRDFQQYNPDEEVDLKKQDFTFANFGDNSLR